jgi:hypothetical protein
VLRPSRARAHAPGQVIAWAPQVLLLGEQELTDLIRLWSKYQVGVDERAGM